MPSHVHRHPPLWCGAARCKDESPTGVSDAAQRRIDDLQRLEFTENAAWSGVPASTAAPTVAHSSVAAVTVDVAVTDPAAGATQSTSTRKRPSRFKDAPADESAHPAAGHDDGYKRSRLL